MGILNRRARSRTQSEIQILICDAFSLRSGASSAVQFIFQVLEKLFSLKGLLEGFILQASIKAARSYQSMSKSIALGGWAVLLVCLFGGCNKNSGTTANGPKILHLAFITNNASDFWTIARAGCQKAQEELPNVQVDFQIPGDGSAATQVRIIDDLLAKGVDGISISPVDPENETPKLNDVASQTLLFCHDSDAPDSNRVCYVGTNNIDAGKLAGEQILKALPGGGKIMLFVGTLDAQNAKDRYAGIKQVLAGSNITIIDVRTDETDRVRAKANAQDTLVNYPDVAGLVGLWSYNGPAILSAVKDAGKVGKVKIICFDEEDETLAGVKSGAIFSTVVQQPYEFGHQAITLMARYLGGDKSFIPAGKQIFIPTLAIDQSNVDDFWARLNKLRGR
jgi:ribose transport system substrate-binding protein